MAKPVRNTPSLFDVHHEDETPPAEETRSFVELVGERPTEPPTFVERVRPEMASGEKGKARDILAAIRTLQLVEREHRPATPQERDALARFSGFGPVALSIFPNPANGEYKDAGWQAIGEELKGLLTPDEYASAKRTTFNAFYTSSTVIRAMFQALARLGVPDDALVLEPGCGPARFPLLAPKDMRFIGVELDGISGRIAKALHPGQDIRIENFTDTKLPADRIDAVIGTRALNRVPDYVDWTKQYPLGTFRGLTFGIERHPGGGADVYLEGQAIRKSMLSKESQGPRAVLNALGRLAASYGEQVEAVRREREMTQRQLGDYQARLGKPFAHAAYLDELTDLRDRLKLALSDRPAEQEQGPSASELAEKIKALRESHVVEAAPSRAKKPERKAPKPKPVVEEVQEEAPPLVEPSPPEEEVPTVSFRERVRPTGTQLRLF